MTILVVDAEKNGNRRITCLKAHRDEPPDVADGDGRVQIMLSQETSKEESAVSPRFSE